MLLDNLNILLFRNFAAEFVQDIPELKFCMIL